jgi:hypothetical protein
LVVFRDLMAKSNLARKKPNKPLKATSTAEIDLVRGFAGPGPTRRGVVRSELISQEGRLSPGNMILSYSFHQIEYTILRVGSMEVHVLEKR